MSKSIMHAKDGSCYLCNLLGTKPLDAYREEHHVFNGPNRQISEHYGLKVYLCISHHTIGFDAVHNNAAHMLMLKKEGQKAFIKKYPNKDFRDIFGKNYLEKSDLEVATDVTDAEELGFHIRPGYEHLMGRFMKRT